MSEDHKQTVLVVEDQDEITANMKAMLVRKGYRVLHAKDADGALKAAEHTPPAVILTDLDLPSLGQLMDQLRVHETLRNLLVAVIDINHPENVRSDLTILNSFDELDQLIAATRER